MVVYGEMSVRQKVSRPSVLTAKCPHGEMSYGEMSYSEMSYGEMSYGEKSYGEKSGHGRRGVRDPGSVRWA